MAFLKRYKVVLAAIVILIFFYLSYSQKEDQNHLPAPASVAGERINDTVIDAFANRRSDVQVEGSGRVV